MSWHIEIEPSTPAADAVALVRKHQQEFFKDALAEVHEQIDAAVATLERLLPVVQPDPAGVVRGSLSGHANPGHKPAEGWANDEVTVRLLQG